jgi:hypothetical protein
VFTIGANVLLMQSAPPSSLVVYEEKQITISDAHAPSKVSDIDYSI